MSWSPAWRRPDGSWRKPPPRWKLSVACDVEPALLKRWVSIYFEKMAKQGEQEARRWFFRFVPDECKPYVMVEVRKGKPT
jgi:hypothetical protein